MIDSWIGPTIDEEEHCLAMAKLLHDEAHTTIWVARQLAGDVPAGSSIEGLLEGTTYRWLGEVRGMHSVASLEASVGAFGFWVRIRLWQVWKCCLNAASPRW